MDPIAAFDEEVAALSKSVEGEMLPADTDPPDLLYHYTSIDGLLGMVKDKMIYATDFRLVNDSSELAYAQGLIQDHIEKAHYPAVAEQLLNACFVAGLLVTTAVSMHYLTCFCAEGDLLSMWRGYAGGRGMGYALGFRREELANMAYCLPKGGQTVLPVEYRRERQNELVAKLLDGLASALLAATAGSCVNARAICDRIMTHEMARDAHQLLARMMYTFKNPVFKEEREWRLVVRSHLAFGPGSGSLINEFRADKGRLVPYVKVPLECLGDDSEGLRSIVPQEIVYGPTLDPIVTDHALRALLIQEGLSGCTFRKSEAPFRA